MTAKRDSQRNRVYTWENRVVAPRDPSFVSFPEAQGMVNAIWSEMGLLYPPRVEPLPKQAKATVATATRLSIRLPERISSWCLLHEIAHAMTTTYDGLSDGHGAKFVGFYIRLLVRYLRFEQDHLITSLLNDRISYEIELRAPFLD